MHQINPYGMPMSHVHHHGAHFLDDQRLGTLSEPGAHFADLSDLQSEIGKPLNKGLKGLSASVPDLTGKFVRSFESHIPKKFRAIFCRGSTVANENGCPDL